jgi:hypothetical protein
MYYFFPLNIDYYSQIAIEDVMAEILLSIHLVTLPPFITPLGHFES